MKVYQTKVNKLTGTDFTEIHKKSLVLYKDVKKRTKRRPYIRSTYFNKDKIFMAFFWQHLFEEKNWRDRYRRLKFFPCVLDLIKNSHLDPISKENPNKRSEILHRFAGMTKDGELFFVQIKEYKKTGQKWLVSIFPSTKKTFR